MSFKTDESSRPGLEETRRSRPAFLQFTVRDLLVLMLGLSIISAIVFAFPNWLASATVMIASILLMATLTTAVVYARGHVRAFCIGALFPSVLVAIAVACLFVVMTFEAFRNNYDEIFDWLDRTASGLRFASVAGWLTAIVAGALSVLVQRHFLRVR